MGITFRHDAAAVVPPSNAATRKYGQNLVLQQQQQKYQSQQAGYDRLFDAYKQQNQNIFQWNRDQAQNKFQTEQEKIRNQFQTERDKMLFERQQQEQRAADFAAARSRMDTYAKDALNNPNLPQDLRQRLQNLIAGKMAVLGNDYDDVARQEYLDDYNAQIAAILAEIPPQAPPPTAQDKFDQGIVVDKETGKRYRQNSRGDWEELPAGSQPPQSVSDAFKDKDTRDKYEADADSMLTQGDPTNRPLNDNGEPMTDREYRIARNKLAAELWAIDQESYAAPPPAAEKPSPSPKFGMVDPVTGQQYQTGDYETLPDSGQTSAPPVDSDLPEMTPKQAAYHAEMTSKGYQLMKDSGGGYFYYHPGPKGQDGPDATQPNLTVTPPDEGQPPMPDAAASVQAPPVEQPGEQQNPWSEVAGDTAPKTGGNTGPTRANIDPTKPSRPQPQFDKLMASASDDTDRAFISNAQEIYSSQTPEVQDAISTLLDSGSPREAKLQAYMRLQEAGIDLAKMTSAPERPPFHRNKNRDFESGRGL